MRSAIAGATKLPWTIQAHVQLRRALVPLLEHSRGRRWPKPCEFRRCFFSGRGQPPRHYRRFRARLASPTSPSASPRLGELPCASSLLRRGVFLPATDELPPPPRLVVAGVAPVTIWSQRRHPQNRLGLLHAPRCFNSCNFHSIHRFESVRGNLGIS